jgi:bifunctional DNA-binding transcriptional regulator/antitoxin component of YhaV-PrlF toxin-antitoxin module
MLRYVKTFPRSWRRWFTSEKGDLKEIHVRKYSYLISKKKKKNVAKLS